MILLIFTRFRITALHVHLELVCSTTSNSHHRPTTEVCNRTRPLARALLEGSSSRLVVSAQNLAESRRGQWHHSTRTTPLLLIVAIPVKAFGGPTAYSSPWLREVDGPRPVEVYFAPRSSALPGSFRET